MPAVTITPDDLAPFATIDEARATAMIEDVLALAALVAPCITSDTFTKPAAAKAILRAAILRWHDSGTGVVQTQTAGPFGQTVDTRQQRRSMFWPQEIEDLQALCRESTTAAGVFDVDTVRVGTGHAQVCALNFGALYCSCGAVLTVEQYPLYELP